MSFLLMIFLTLVCLFADQYPTPFWRPSDTPEGWLDLSILLTLFCPLLIALNAWQISRPVSRCAAIGQPPHEALLDRYDRRRFRHQILQFVLYALAIGVFGWGWAVFRLWRMPGGILLPGLELILLAPFFLGQTLSWLCFYDADRVADPPLANEANSYSARWGYVVFQWRQRLSLVCIPLALLILQKEIFRRLPVEWQQWQLFVNGVGVGGFLVVLVLMPWIVRVLLGLRPLPESPIRERLLLATRRLGFHCSDILVWNTRCGMANAMVIGFVPWLRYVVFTDRFLADFDEAEVEAVYGHEIGHLRHRHMVFYLVFLVASVIVMGVVAEAWVLPLLGQVLSMWFPQQAATWVEPNGILAPFVVVGLLGTYLGLVFGRLSRACELQADLFGSRSLGNREGVRVFINALEKVARINGMNRERQGFLHPSIARRVDFLHEILADASAESQFQQRLRRCQMVLLGTLLPAAGLLLMVYGWKW
jgi:Zn-dependent protease with chaperone function